MLLSSHILSLPQGHPNIPGEIDCNATSQEMHPPNELLVHGNDEHINTVRLHSLTDRTRIEIP